MLVSKRSVLLSALVLFAFISGLAFSAHTPTQAQDDMNTVTCDSTLVTLLYIAEHDYGFHSMMDVSMLDKGQYGPLFDEMMAMMDDSDMSSDDMAESGDDMGEDMSEGDMMESMTTLTPGNVAGEDQFCTDLRAELDTFFYDTFNQAMMGDESDN